MVGLNVGLSGDDGLLNSHEHPRKHLAGPEKITRLFQNSLRPIIFFLGKKSELSNHHRVRMTNIFNSPKKHERKKRLFQIGVEVLEAQGWTVAKEKGLGKSSVRRISKAGDSKLVSIRT